MKIIKQYHEDGTHSFSVETPNTNLTFGRRSPVVLREEVEVQNKDEIKTELHRYQNEDKDDIIKKAKQEQDKKNEKEKEKK